ncbi:hypothetical protein LVY72_10195 [Arthrobacter sp. I2-34]|uniref:Uncharacterized protein n=1 Tax=Arthrobacter hankyongi TaxID=2904801 RepID=A0ABS9L6I4_9MICC|nr:hypothetical protein [Arthrobacter hankyongi]MCG2622287.1 hypothetical protein [Arthrobacter hankyongi]
MSEEELDFVRGDVVVQYKRRAARLDRRHLIVSFAGVGPLDKFEFDGPSTKESQAAWLWLKDNFDGQHAYYLCHRMDHAIEDAVIELIDAELARLELTRDECTLLGVSKGGFAALYFGIKYGFRNIVASAPQIYVGTHTRRHRRKIFARLSGNGGDQEQQLLDALLPDAVEADDATDKNIYLFSSPNDQFHEAQIVPALPMFDKYKNFNYIETDSDLVNEHTEVTRYNLPLIISTLFALSDNAAPQFGRIRNGSRMAPERIQAVLERQRAEGSAVVNFSFARLAEGLFFPEGTAFLKGRPMTGETAPATVLVLNGPGRRHEFPLGAVVDSSPSFKYFDEAYCNYRLGRFSSPKKQGIDLSSLSDGTYEMWLRLAGGDGELEFPARSDQPLQTESPHGGRLFRFRSSGRRAVLDIRSVLGERPGKSYFGLHKSWARDQLVHVEGDFAVRGAEMPDDAAGNYYLVLQGGDREGQRVHALPLVAATYRGPEDPFGDGFSDYSFARFRSRRREGADTSQVPPGEYLAYISFSHSGVVYTVAAGKKVEIRIVDGAVSTSIRRAAGGRGARRRALMRRVVRADLPQQLRHRLRTLGK